MSTRIDPFAMKFASPSEFGMLLSAAGRVRPAFYDDVKQLWVMLRHGDVTSAFRDPERFSATFYQVGPLNGSFLAQDGDAHQRGRRAFTRAFAPLAVRRAEEFILPAAQRIVGELERKGGADLVTEFCLQLPMQVIGDLLGVGLDLIRECLTCVPTLIRWIVFWADPQLAAEGRAAQQQMRDRLRPFVERQVAQPGDNLVGGLVREMHDEGVVDVEQITHLAFGLILGGYETTAGMLAATLSSLLLHPEVMERVRRDRALLMPAVEEAGRWANPSLGVMRRALRDVELDGVVIPAGSPVLLCSAAAHYDEAVFPRPEVYDLDRKPENLIFGGGQHYCLGAPLARLEAKLGLSLLLDRLPDLRLDPERPPVFTCGMHGTIIHGPEELHVRYTGQAERKAA